MKSTDTIQMSHSVVSLRRYNQPVGTQLMLDFSPQDICVIDPEFAHQETRGMLCIQIYHNQLHIFWETVCPGCSLLR